MQRLLHTDFLLFYRKYLDYVLVIRTRKEKMILLAFAYILLASANDDPAFFIPGIASVSVTHRELRQ